MSHYSVLVGLAALGTGAALAAVNPALPAINTNNIITITNAPYNAVGNGIITNTTAIQNAINAAAKGGQTNGLYGGTVKIPAPGIYLCGPLNFSNYLNLQIDAGATLRMLPYGQYPGYPYSISSTVPDFLNASSLHDLEISGSGGIDGQGSPWWPGYKTNNRPVIAYFSACSKILIQDATFSNSPSPHLVIKGKAGNVTIQGVTIKAPSSSDPVNPSHNTDAIDLAETNALIQNCNISVGDDNLAVGSSASVSCDILITNCFFGAGHGCSIGSYTSGGVSNLTAINCSFSGTDNGIRLKSQRDRGGIIQNCNYYNLTMTNVDWPLLIYSYYEFGLGTITGVDPAFAAYTAYTNPTTITGTTPFWRNITFSNITATVPSGRPPLMVWGLPEAPASNIVFRAVNLTSGSTYDPGIYNVTNLQVIDCSFSLPPGVNSVQFWNADLIFTNQSMATNLWRLDGLTTNGIGNSLKFYNVLGLLRNTNAIDNGPLCLGASTLTISNNFTLFPSTVLNYTLGTNLTQVAVSSNLTLGGAINVAAGPGFGPGTNTVLTYGRNLYGNVPSLGSTPPGYIYSFDTNTPGQVNLLVQFSNTPPVLAPISNQVLNAGITFLLTNVATDTDSPPQVLTFSLLAGPANALLNPSNGIFSWRPLVSEADTSNFFKLKVADNGSPNLSATQSFSATVNPLARPSLSSPGCVGGQFSLSVSGAVGPDYTILASSNLATTNWSPLFATNAPATPFSWIDPGASTNPARFYRILLGP